MVGSVIPSSYQVKESVTDFYALGCTPGALSGEGVRRTTSCNLSHASTTAHQLAIIFLKNQAPPVPGAVFVSGRHGLILKLWSSPTDTG